MLSLAEFWCLTSTVWWARTTVSYSRSTVEFPNKSWGANTKGSRGVCTVPVRLIEKSMCPAVNLSSSTSTKFVTLNFETRETPPVILFPLPIALQSLHAARLLWRFVLIPVSAETPSCHVPGTFFKKKKKMFTLWVWFISISAFWHLFF